MAFWRHWQKNGAKNSRVYQTRILPHEATYTSPFFLEHGRDIRLSYTYEKNSDTPQNKYEYVEKLLPSLEHTFNKVLKNLKDQEASHVELSTRATKQHHYDYKIGSLCFIKTPNIKSNLSPKTQT
ncbi:integrase catalytic domain-containing protein [Trichonephila clavipes]|nr:integrase catalytic domain-containing protein [Trichonephila clavipes]